MILSIRDLVVDYGAARAVDHVSLDVAPGEVLGLAGESGSGKSTLVMAALRLLRAPAVIRGGSVHLDGKDVLAMSPAELRAIRWREASLVMQSALDALNPVLTVGDQLVDTLLAHPPHPSRVAARGRAMELMELAGLPYGLLDRYPHQLSGGQRQRVGMALALALNPKLVALDEPTTALDVIVQREVLQRLMQLRARFGFAVVFVTHDLPLLLHLADRVAVMRQGRIVEIGAAARIRSAPAHPYTRQLLDSIPSLDRPRPMEKSS
ncbi:MAG: ABC transporter ATP-binding protein [Myxococcota bacterium]